MPKIAKVCLSCALALNAIAALGAQWDTVDQALGRKGTPQPGGISKYGFPRTDLTVTVDGIQLKGPLALGTWIAFAPMGSQAQVMGDLVLTDTELNPVMKRLIDQGFEISAIHNHLIRTSVPVLYMHISGHGDPAKLADTLHGALALTGTPLSAPASAPTSAPIDMDIAAIDQTLGGKGSSNGGVYQFSIPRREQITDAGMVVPPSMGTAIAINFQPTGSGKAVVTGDFVLLGTEVNPVLRALRAHGIEVTALHSHMIEETPRLYFMHFWGNAEAKQLAQGLRAALDLTQVAR